MKTRLAGKREVAEKTLAITLEPIGERLEFQAGQACDLILPNPAYQDDRGNRRTFTVASSPGDDRLLFAMRLTGSALKRSLSEAPPGTEIEIEGPFGVLTLHEDPARPAVFLAGGIGITPFRSIIKDVTEKKISRRMTLVYSSRSASGMAFLEELESWERENPNFRLIATLTQPEPGEPWSHHRGRMDLEFLKKHLGRLEEAVYYIVGPVGFVSALQAALPQVGVDPKDIVAEEFWGY